MTSEEGEPQQSVTVTLAVGGMVLVGALTLGMILLCCGCLLG